MNPKDLDPETLKKLSELATSELGMAAYYRAVIDVASEFEVLGDRGRMLAVLKRVPSDYFYSQDFILECLDADFRGRAADMALLVLNFGGRPSEGN